MSHTPGSPAKRQDRRLSAHRREGGAGSRNCLVLAPLQSRPDCYPVPWALLCCRPCMGTDKPKTSQAPIPAAGGSLREDSCSWFGPTQAQHLHSWLRFSMAPTRNANQFQSEMSSRVKTVSETHVLQK